ncbi:TadE family protein [Caulobacter sp. 73W]|uniref:TadE family protein n=1 Tax=Caulobacter sp. 73W TaxID=3161137 RepID=A0AB39KPQ1_9CAUL
MTKTLDEEGSAAVEFALVAPILLLILMGIVSAGIYLATMLAVSNTAMEAARATIPGMTVAERRTLATARADTMLSAYEPFLVESEATVVADPAGTNAFSVQITYKMDRFAGARLAGVIGLPKEITRTAVVANGGY